MEVQKQKHRGNATYHPIAHMPLSPPIVHQLQQLAADQSSDLATVLRKGLIVASKLGLVDLRAWILRELNGYGRKDDVPDYRHIKTRIAYDGPRGEVAIHFKNAEQSREFSRYEMRLSIAQLTHLLKSGEGQGPDLGVSMPPELASFLVEQAGNDGLLNPVMRFNRSYVENILDRVRTSLLEWALELEKAGIVGSDITFSSEEVNKATSTTIFNIQTFQGILGAVSNSTVTQDLRQHIHRADFESLRRALAEKGISSDDLKALKVAIESDPSQVHGRALGPKVGAWVGGMIQKAATETWQIGIGAAGNLLASALGAYYGGPS